MGQDIGTAHPENTSGNRNKKYQNGTRPKQRTPKKKTLLNTANIRKEAESLPKAD